MKHKFLLFTIFMLVGLFVRTSYCQIPTYTCTLVNDVQVSDSIFEFDIYLLRTGTTDFELAGWQGGFTYNDAIKNGGTLTAAWVPGSPDPALVASGQVNNSFNTATDGVIKIASKVPPGAGNGAIISNVAPGTRMGRLRLKNSTAFLTQKATITWCFSVSIYPTNVNAYVPAGVGGINTSITDSTKFFNNLANPTLPVELTSFMSNVSGREIDLSWETKSEVNTRQFEIDRVLVSTKDATVTWASVGTIKAAGTSTTPKMYSYTEKNLPAGKYQYRLKMIDNDGSYKLSDVVETEIALPKNFELSQNYPNPFNPSTRINYSIPFDSKVTLEVYNITGERIGQIVNQEQSAGYYTVNFSSSNLNRSVASGVYIYKINAVDKSTGNVFTSIKKMMLLK
jgi:hypothetical protein